MLEVTRVCMQAYDGMMFREALKAGWYDLHKARDTYRSFVQEEGMHKDLALRFAEVGRTNSWFGWQSIVFQST